MSDRTSLAHCIHLSDADIAIFNTIKSLYGPLFPYLLMKSPKEIVQDWVIAYNTRDPYTLIELYHENAENHQVAFGAPLRGREALLESFVVFFQAFPDNYTHIENLFEDGEWAIIEWSGGGTFLGEFGGNPPNGKSFKLQGCGFFHVVDGKIRFQRGYIDKQTWFTQLQLPVV